MKQETKNLTILIVTIGIFLLITAYLMGCQGPRGDTGFTGARGPQGDVGPQGPSIPVTATPASPIDCPTGGTVVTVGINSFDICNGATGAPGQTGIAGQNGTNGTNGTDAASVTTVQFCSSATSSYPNSFPEFGICISGQLYGVYSTNGGFLSLLPPGEYSSDGVNASCTFTIGDNCEVSQ